MAFPQFQRNWQIEFVQVNLLILSGQKLNANYYIRASSAAQELLKSESMVLEKGMSTIGHYIEVNKVGHHPNNIVCALKKATA